MSAKAKSLGFSCLLVGLAGCVSEMPQDYSPHYRYVATAGDASGKGVAGSVLAPEACLGAPADTLKPGADEFMTIVPSVGPHLPPGCANAYNLQRMVESRKDLIEGRQMGPAPAAPTVRAARRYLDGPPAESETGDATE